MAKQLSIFAEPSFREPRKPKIETFWRVLGDHPNARLTRYPTRNDAVNAAKNLVTKGFNVTLGFTECRNGDCWVWAPEQKHQWGGA